jgi:hypothetical protein
MPRKNYVNFRITDERRKLFETLAHWMGQGMDDHAVFVDIIDYALRNNPITRRDLRPDEQKTPCFTCGINVRLEPADLRVQCPDCREADAIADEYR